MSHIVSALGPPDDKYKPKKEEKTMSDLIERIVTKGDISALSPSDKVDYYRQIC